jgi:simple sugar transport system permease protein
MNFKRLIRRSETILLIIIIILSLAIGIKSPAFLSVASVFDIFRSSIVQLIFALAVLIVIVSGGIDISFPTIGIASGYTAVVIMQKFEVNPNSLVVPLILSVAIGLLLGSVNALLIAGFRIPTLIATLGTAGIFRGSLLSFVGITYISEIPMGLDNFATADLLKIESETAPLARLHILIIPVALLLLSVSFLLRRTMFGRSVYALGGGTESARRLGISTRRVQVKIYMLVGALSGFAGILFVSLQRKASPYDLASAELEVIAAVVLGGASIMGGYGTVFGTVLGVLLINLIKGNLILLGVSSSWQRAAVGLLLIIGITVQAISETKKVRKRRLSMDDEVITL